MPDLSPYERTPPAVLGAVIVGAALTLAFAAGFACGWWW
jgi:hypothetical protein